MDNNYKGESFLNRLYKDLHMSDEVMHSASSNDTKDEKVSRYLERLEKVEELAKSSKYNGIQLLKEMYYKKYVIKPENIPESYFKKQKEIALDRGFGHVEISNNEREIMIGSIINDQKKSLDVWLNYFLSNDAKYPKWFKYYAFQGMLKLGSYDKGKMTFNKRTNSTTNIFVDLNREALALVYDNLCSVLEGNQVDDEILQRLLEGGSFSKLYAYMLKKIDSSKKDTLNGNDGIWIKYDQGSEPYELVSSLEGRGTGWCTAGLETARSQLRGGDFYVYYTKDSNDEYKQPRIAIRMEGDSIGEIRGIGGQQNLEPEMEGVLNKKLDEFPDSEKYMKKVRDMKLLTSIYKEYKMRELTKEELRFLYEIDSEIDGFGYEKDPRINEIIIERKAAKRDLSKVFDCSEDEISNNLYDVLNGKNIVYFVGDLNFSTYTDLDGLILPRYIRGSLYLNCIEEAENLILPKSVKGNLELSGLTNVKDLILPESVGGFLNLTSLTNIKNITLPKSVGGLDLHSLTCEQGLTLPKNIDGDLDLGGLTSAKNLVFPENIGGSLNLESITNAEGLTLPKTIGLSLYLDHLNNAQGLTLPKSVGEDLIFNKLTTVEDLILPRNIGCDLYLGKLVSASNLVLPEIIGGSLYLTQLTSVDGLIVSKDFSYGGFGSINITIQDLINKSLENREIKGK